MTRFLIGVATIVIALLFVRVLTWLRVLRPISDLGIVSIKSVHSFEQTLSNVKRELKAKGLKLFDLIDQSREATQVGLELLPTTLVLFGDPDKGTRLMVEVPSIAIDLPLKLLVWEDVHAQVWISYNAPEHLQRRHVLPRDLVGTLSIVEQLAKHAAR